MGLIHATVMKKQIVLFGAGKSSTCLINYLLKASAHNQWHLTVADSNLLLAQSKIGLSALASAVFISAENDQHRSALIKTGDLIISLLPPALHFLVAQDCVKYRKNLLTASYVDDQIMSLGEAVKSNELFFLCEMGLDPGIDHMSSVKLIHDIKQQGGEITSYVSHCGGLVAPESDVNPLRYKISWNSRNIVLAGKAGATFKINNIIKHLNYEEVFSSCKQINIGPLGKLVSYPNRDSLNYLPVYNLNDAVTFMRTTLRYPEFCTAWNSIVKAGLTNDMAPVHVKRLTFRKWSQEILPFVNDSNREQLEYLGLFDDALVPYTCISSADILQFLLESKMMMLPDDKDMVVMMHEVAYLLEGKHYRRESLLIVKGRDNVHTAMAKTVGLPLGIAAKLILQEKIKLTGLHIPVLREIYEPVLKELALEGIVFEETEVSNQ